jgi:hypothetical protein
LCDTSAESVGLTTETTDLSLDSGLEPKVGGRSQSQAIDSVRRWCRIFPREEKWQRFRVGITANGFTWNKTAAKAKAHGKGHSGEPLGRLRCNQLYRFTRQRVSLRILMVAIVIAVMVAFTLVPVVIAVILVVPVPLV